MLKNYIKEALAIQQEEGDASDEALKKYLAGINSYNLNQDQEYDFLYANYQAMWIYSNLGESGKALPLAKQCMA